MGGAARGRALKIATASFLEPTPHNTFPLPDTMGSKTKADKPAKAEKPSKKSKKEEPGAFGWALAWVLFR